MRILCISYEYPPIGGGGAPFCEGLAEALVRSGHDVDVVTSGMSDLPAFEVRRGVRVYRVRCFRRYRHYSTIPELATQVLPSLRRALDLARQGEYDINHTHFVVPSGITAYLLRMRTGLPYVLTAHGSDIPGYNPDRFVRAHRLIRPVWGRILRSSASVHAPSRFLKGLIESHIDIPVQVIPYGFDPPERPAPVERRNRLLVVTRMFERKGVQFLIRALEDIAMPWEVCIVGDGPYLSVLKDLSSRLSVPVRFVGFVQGEELRELYVSSKVLVFPSLQENFPVVLLEAMAFGCAVVTTSAAGCAEVVGDAAIKVKPGDVHSLRGAIGRLVRSPAEVDRLAGLGRERIRRFSWSRITGQFEELFEQTAGSPG